MRLSERCGLCAAIALILLTGCEKDESRSSSSSPTPTAAQRAAINAPAPTVQLAPLEVRRFIDGRADFVSVAVAPDGGSALSGGRTDTTLRLWDTGTGQRLRAYEDAPGATHVAFSSDGSEAIYAGPQFPFTVLNLQSGDQGQVSVGHPGQAACIAISPTENRAATGAADPSVLSRGSVFLWDLETGDEAGRFGGHTAPVSAVAYSPDGNYLASSSLDGTVRIWRVDDGNEMRSFSTGRPVWDVAYAKSGLHVLSGGESAAATLWDLSQGSALGTLEHPVGHIRSVALSPDGALAATGGDRLYPKIHLWDLGTGRVLHIYDGHTDAIIDLIFTPSGTHLLSCSDDGTMRLWQQPR